MAGEVINLRAAGSNPRVVIDFDGPTFGVFRLFLKAPGSAAWREFTQGDSRTSHHDIELDPAALGIGGTVAAFHQWQFGWVVVFLGLDETEDEPYAIRLDTVQNGAPVMVPPLQEAGTFNAPSKSFTGSRRFEVA